MAVFVFSKNEYLIYLINALAYQLIVTFYIISISMRSTLLTILLAIFIYSCNTTESDSKLTLISPHETIQRAMDGKLDYSYAEFKNKNGEELTEQDRRLLNQGKMAKDYYEDENGLIKEVRVRPIELNDKFNEIQIRAISNNPIADIEIIDVDCENINYLYSEIEKTDQEVRNNGGDMLEVDRLNQQLLISILSKCGWTEEHLHTAWLVFQHSPTEMMAYYYPKLKEYSNQGKISASTLALMEDRLLMNNGYKQVYGSQIRNGSLYDLEDPDNVNKRRSEIGLGPIEEYISMWGLNFEDEKERMKTDH